MKRIKLTILIIPILLFSCTSGYTQQQVSKIKSTDLKTMIEETDDLQLLDVRTPDEVANGKIAGSTNINFYDPEFINKVKELDKEQPIVIYCAAGGRSSRATDKLKELGFNTIYDLSDGFTGWAAGGNPIEKQ